MLKWIETPPSTMVQMMIPLGGSFPALTGFEVLE